MSPPVDWLKVRAEGYFAITANSLQFGGKRHGQRRSRAGRAAKRGSASTRCSSGRRASISYSSSTPASRSRRSAHVVAACRSTASCRACIRGISRAHASVTILFWDVSVDIGPIEWGERDTSTAPADLSREGRGRSLNATAAWKPRLPAEHGHARALRRGRHHAAARASARRRSKSGSSRSRSRPDRPHRLEPGDVAPRATSLIRRSAGRRGSGLARHGSVRARPLHQDVARTSRPRARISRRSRAGMRVAASRRDVRPAIKQTYEWETYYPHEELCADRGAWALKALGGLAFRTNAVAQATRMRRQSLHAGGPASNPVTN